MWNEIRLTILNAVRMKRLYRSSSSFKSLHGHRKNTHVQATLGGLVKFL